MDKRKAYPKITASDFGKTHEDLLKSFTKTQNQTIIDRLQEQTNRSLKKLVKDTRKNNPEIIKNDIRLTNTNGGNFGGIDEVSTKDGIGKIKPLSNEEFQKIVVSKGSSKDFSELNALMHNSKTKKGYIHYVNADNPYQQRTIRHRYDPNKYTQDLDKVKKIQSYVNKKKTFVDPTNQSSKKMSTLTDTDFLTSHTRLQEVKEQSIAHAGIKSNNPFLRNMRRENRPVIEGMQHGWFGRMRKVATAFGSPFRLGAYSDILNLNQEELNSAFDHQYGLDIETKSLKANNHSTFQISLKKGDKYNSYFLQQKDDFNLSKHPFLYDQTAIGKLHRNKPFDFTTVQKIPGYGDQLREQLPTFAGNVDAQIVKRKVAREAVSDFIDQAKLQNKNILAMNANFEIKHFENFFDEISPVNYSEEFLELRRKVNKENKKILSKIKLKQISEEDGFSQIVANQKIKFTQVMNEALAKEGNIIEIQELTKTLNAVAQEKNLIPRTGRFGVGTNINFLAKTFLGELEHHDANLDNEQQARVAKKIVNTIQELESGKGYSQETSKWLNTWRTEGKTIYEDSTYRMIKNQVETGASLSEIDPAFNREFRLLSNSEIDPEKMFLEQKTKYFNSPEYKGALQSNKSITNVSPDNLRKARVGSLLFGGILLGSALTNLFTFSGRDDAANTIEGLGHGSPIQEERQYNTSFGSGFRSEKFHQAPQGQDEQEGATWKQLGFTGLGAAGAYGVFKHQASKMRLNDLTYLGRLDKKKDNEKLLGRTQATAQDVMVAGARRLENTFGGFGKAFGIGDVLSLGMYDNAAFEVEFRGREGATYAEYMNKLLNRKLVEEGVDSIMFKKGELFERINGEYRKVKGKYSLLKTVTNHDLSDSISSLAKGVANEKGIRNTKNLASLPFLIVGGETDYKRFTDFANGFINESVSKVMKLLADPGEALRDIFPDMDARVTPAIKKVLSPKWMPDIGLDGAELVTDWRSMLKTHAGKLTTFGTLAYLGLGTLNWGAQTLAPDGTPIGDAGLIGAGAYTIKKGHELYARFSDITGLTSLRDYVDEKAPGSEGWQTTIGLAASGALAGALYGGVQDLVAESTAQNKYQAFLERKQKSEKFEGKLGKVFKGEYTKTGKAARIGGLIGFAAALPFTLAGLGADSSASQLASEYSGEKEVAVRKGRFWESGFTPWEGGEIDYYRPNWYAKLMSDAKDKELYGENIAPLTEVYRGIVDPYWREKRRYHDQPYPITGPDGSMMGIFGPAYEATLGRIIKPVATMHASVLPEELLNNTEYDIDALARKQWNATLEFMGLRGFAVKALKENLTGSQEIFADPNEARSAKDIDSIVRDFYDLQIGGGMLTSEAIRRVFQSQDGFQKAQMSASVNLNPLKNNMPSWMPGSDYVQDFKSGDPFMKVKDGYYRLPGAGFATRYKDLEGVNPEDYADIYKYKILADVAYGSREFRAVKGSLQNRELTSHEQFIFDEVQSQIEEKKKSEVNIRDPSTYDSFLGRYSAMLTDLARSNPLETLLPFSPAHKFLAPADIEDYMEEQRYSKDYRSWANPVDDFVLPAVSMTMNSLGLGGINMLDEQEDIDDYFDKVEYLKQSNLAREAQAKGDLRTADKHTIAAQKTYSGKDLYRHHADIASSLPHNERKTFNYFAGADLLTKQRMMDKVNPRYKDAYQAQLDMHMMRDLEGGKVNKTQKARVMKEIQARQKAIEARRKADIQDAKKIAPGSDWAGWSPNSSMSNIKKGYIQNKARDYHGYQPRRNSQMSEADKLAIGEIPQDISRPASYTEHYSELNKAGVENTLVVLRPGLDNGATVNIKVDRRQQRNEVFRNWGYIQ